MMRLICLLFVLVSPAWAQTYPDYQSTTVNDFAQVIGPETEAQLDQTLKDLYSTTGFEFTVVTLESQESLAPNMSLEAYATGLFNAWGVGNDVRNDGVMVLIFTQDRAMRIELGAGFGRDWDRVAAKVIDDHFLPKFAQDQIEAGITEGVAATISDILTPFRTARMQNAKASFDSNQTPDAPADETVDAPFEVPSRDYDYNGLLPLIGFGVLMLIFRFHRRIADFLAAKHPCPSCGRRDLRRNRRVLNGPTRLASGSGELTISCPHCDYSKTETYAIPLNGFFSGGGGFGGGRSGGGGASGRW